MKRLENKTVYNETLHIIIWKAMYNKGKKKTSETLYEIQTSLNSFHLCVFLFIRGLAKGKRLMAM